MKIISLSTENFKRLKAVQITPDGNLVTISGKNGAGKSSILDAIWVGLVGKSVAPPKPVRAGEEQAIIRLDLGDIIVTRRFTEKDGKQTDAVKVESPEGLKYPSPQKVLDELLGEIGFDPFAFVQMKPDDQAVTLRSMVPLSVDLDELAEKDRVDYAERTAINREGVAAKARLEAIPVVAAEDMPAAVDRDALVAKLGDAANTNIEIERQRVERERMQETINNRGQQAIDLLARAAELRREAEAADADAAMISKGTVERQTELDALPPLAEPIETDAVREEIREAEAAQAIIDQQAARATLAEEVDALRAKSQALTDAMAAREKERADALATAKMPIDGLSFAVENGKQRVLFNGVPFEQASSAEQLRASTAIAMAANPSLRVLRIKDGSLLDDDSMKMLAEMADAEDFQLWVERVGTGGVGIIIEDGAVKDAGPVAQPEDPEQPAGDITDQLKAEAPKKAKAKKAPPADGGLL